MGNAMQQSLAFKSSLVRTNRICAHASQTWKSFSVKQSVTNVDSLVT
jgi:hypothetical protein